MTNKREVDYTSLPSHMQGSARAWVERGFPHPTAMGGFMRALLANDLIEAFQAADEDNSHAIHAWVKWLGVEAPASCFGSREALFAWHDRGGLLGPTERK